MVAAVRRGVETLEPPPPPSPDLPPWFIRGAALMPGPGLEPVVAVLQGQLDLAVFDNHMQQMGTQARRITFLELARWLVSRGRALGPEQAVRDLDRYVNEDSFPVVESCLLTGVTVAETREIADGIRLMPFDQLPDSPHKQMFTPTFWDALAISRSHPTAALTCRNNHPKHHAAGDTPPMIPVQPRYAEMADIRLILTLIGPSAPVILAFWSAPEQSVPLGDSVIGWTGPQEQSEVRTGTILVSTDLDRLRELYVLFRELSSGSRQHLRIPLERLNRALRRSDKTDSAIELGIALEALLLNDLDDERGELTLRFRLRGARLLGETLEERANIYRLLGNVYTLRSAAVHRGTIPERLGSTPTGDILENGYRLAARAIEAMIRRGTNPNWEQITLA